MTCGAADEAAVRIGYSKLRISLPVFVAQENGYFRAEGLRVELVGYDTAQPMMSDLVTSRLDAAGYCAFPITFSAQAQTNTRLNYLTLLYEDSKHPISILIVRRDAKPISRLRDLKGTTIGILPTVAYRAWLIEAMRKEGVAENEFSIVNIDPNLSSTALQSKQVTALFSNDPAITAAKRETGAKDPFGDSLTTRYLENPFPFGSFNVREAFASTHPETTQRVARALDKAIEFIRTNPQKAKLMMRPYILPSFQKDVENYPDIAFKLTKDFSNDELRSIANQYTTWHIIKQLPDLSNSVYHLP
jgi:NitT/TauT family transport system substrate-binding protein